MIMTDAASPDTKTPTVGVIGGSGLYSVFESATETTVVISTPYGETSAPIRIGNLGGRTIAFVPRHGDDHSVPPHAINYRANVWAMASLGVRAIVSMTAVGGISPETRPGVFVLPDQIIDRTWGRFDSFFDGATSVQHLPFADPYCPELRSFAAAALEALGEDFVRSGTTVVIQGPRFSSRAESHWFRGAGASIVNMTQYPEVALAAELNVGMVNVSFVTDSDADTGDSEGGAGEATSAELVFERMAAAAPRIRAAVAAIVAAVPSDYAPRNLIPPDAVAAILALVPSVPGDR
jgi:5'-methylthioadenosine phosphorylase